MSYIRLSEQRRYFPGESDLYVYPSEEEEEENLQIRFEGDINGNIKSEDFWELMLRAIEKTDIDNDIFWMVESAVSDYYEYEKNMPHDEEEIRSDLYD